MFYAIFQPCWVVYGGQFPQLNGLCVIVRLVFYFVFNNLFSHITMVAACCMRRDSTRVLNAVNTDAPCRRHITRHEFTNLSYYPDTRPTSPDVILLMISVWRGNNQYQLLAPLVWRGRGPNPRHPDYEANVLSSRPLSLSYS